MDENELFNEWDGPGEGAVRADLYPPDPAYDDAGCVHLQWEHIDGEQGCMHLSIEQAERLSAALFEGAVRLRLLRKPARKTYVN